MLKYILKRLGLSLIVLLGVSVIIYFLVRLMPTNYLENKFSAQIQQGTITHDQLDDFKKRYGLYMPEAYIDIEITGTEFDGTYTKDSRLSKIEDAEDGVITYNDLFAGTYECKKQDTFLELGKNGAYSIYEEKKGEKTELSKGAYSFDEKDEFVNIVLNGGGTTAAYHREAGFFNKFGAVLGGYFQ